MKMSVKILSEGENRHREYGGERRHVRMYFVDVSVMCRYFLDRICFVDENMRCLWNFCEIRGCGLN